jgi:hypothetical protein
MVYPGPLSVDRLVADAAKYATDSTVKASRRSLFHGRWYFRTPRPLAQLAGDLKRRGLIADADFYLGASIFERP